MSTELLVMISAFIPCYTEIKILKNIKNKGITFSGSGQTWILLRADNRSPNAHSQIWVLLEIGHFYNNVGKLKCVKNYAVCQCT